jgi:hypothetical protein
MPVVWVGAGIFAASVAGCIAMIALAGRHADDSLPVTADPLLRVPITRSPQPDSDAKP